jgi:hypothetical protein
MEWDKQCRHFQSCPCRPMIFPYAASGTLPRTEATTIWTPTPPMFCRFSVAQRAILWQVWRLSVVKALTKGSSFSVVWYMGVERVGNVDRPANVKRETTTVVEALEVAVVGGRLLSSVLVWDSCWVFMVECNSWARASPRLKHRRVMTPLDRIEAGPSWLWYLESYEDPAGR